MSSLPNSSFEPGPLPPGFPAPSPHTEREDPVFSGWDVLQIGLVALVSISVLMTLTVVAAHQLLFPRSTLFDVAKMPLVSVLAEFLGYLVTFAFMVGVVKRHASISFWTAVRWNWPGNAGIYLLGGVALSLALQALAHFLPMPKELPIDMFFRTSIEAWVLSIFGITVAPFMEELFFRGFLYPALTRRLGMIIAIVLTSAAFGLIHAPQLGRAWSPVLVVFLVGLVLTITRALTRSVARSMLVHIGYNGMLSLLLFVASDGFRHLERLNQ